MSLRLNDNKVSYIIISAPNSSDLKDDLYQLEYNIVSIDSYLQGDHYESFMAWKTVDNNDLRTEGIHLMDKYKLDGIIIKYLNEPNAKRIQSDGNENNLTVLASFSDDLDTKSYIYENQSFSFIEQKRYFYPKDELDFKIGDKVEMMLNSGEWSERIVESGEYDKLYKLMGKYNKVRILI